MGIGLNALVVCIIIGIVAYSVYKYEKKHYCSCGTRRINQGFENEYTLVCPKCKK